MTASATLVPRKGSWRGVAIAVLLFLLVPFIPQLRAMFPIEQTLVLLIAVIASCMIVGWRQGGRLLLALIWVVLAVAFIAGPSLPAGAHTAFLDRTWGVTSPTAYTTLARGWVVLLAASFGLVNLFSGAQSFISRALSTVALAGGLGFILVLLSPGGPARISGTMALEYTRRNDESIAMIRAAAASSAAAKGKPDAQGIERFDQVVEEQIIEIGKTSAGLVPAILTLESLAAMALAWSLYHRLNPTPLGPALGRLRDFRFNDQLVWGVAVGASIYLLPQFAEARNAGLNILVFFGALYVLRGFGILSWIAKGRILQLVLVFIASFVISAVLAYRMGFLIAPAFPVIALAFALGLGDTWLDWRNLLQPKTV